MENEQRSTTPGLPKINYFSGKSEKYINQLNPGVNNKKAFTLVELIIVITILAILGTIAYITFQGYTKNARDGNRVTTIKNISKGLDINQIQTGEYPFPDGEILTGTINNQQLTYRGEIKENLTRLLKINKIPQDPITQNNYTYAVTQDKKQYQIGTILEGDIVYQNLVKTTHANNYYGKVEGNYKGYLTFGSGAGNTEIWIANIPSILYNYSGSVTYTGIDLLNQTGTYYIVEKGVNLPYAPPGIEKNNKTLSGIIKDKTKNSNSKIITISKTDLLVFIENETIPGYLGGISTGELYSSFGTEKKEELEKLITGVSTTPPQLPGCAAQPNYTNATFTTGTPTQPNQSWQSIDINQGCYWTCGAGKVLLGETCVSENCSGTTPNGTSQVSNATSTAGGTWHYSTTDGVCTYECGAGYYYSGGSCIASSQGYYVGAQGQETQNECGGNAKYQDQTGQTSCKDVSVGYYTTGGTTTTRTGQTQCEAGYYCSGGVRTACGAGLTSPVGSTSVGNCVDGQAPTITNVTTNSPSCNTIRFTINGAVDNIGLHSTPYSFDGGATWQSGNTKDFNSTSYTINSGNIKVRDNSGNIYTYSSNISGGASSCTIIGCSSATIRYNFSDSFSISSIPNSTLICFENSSGQLISIQKNGDGTYTPKQYSFGGSTYNFDSTVTYDIASGRCGTINLNGFGTAITETGCAWNKNNSFYLCHYGDDDFYISSQTNFCMKNTQLGKIRY